MFGGIEKTEIKYILYAEVFAIFWFMIGIPYLLKNNLQNMSPYIQFIFFNLGIFIFLQIFLKRYVGGHKLNLKEGVGLTCLVIALDLFMLPFAVDMDGTLLNGLTLTEGSSDYVFGFLGINLGLSGVWIFLFAYIFMSFILLLIASKLLKDLTKKL